MLYSLIHSFIHSINHSANLLCVNQNMGNHNSSFNTPATAAAPAALKEQNDVDTVAMTIESSDAGGPLRVVYVKTIAPLDPPTTHGDNADWLWGKYQSGLVGPWAPTLDTHGDFERQRMDQLMRCARNKALRMDSAAATNTDPAIQQYCDDFTIGARKTWFANCMATAKRTGTRVDEHASACRLGWEVLEELQSGGIKINQSRPDKVREVRIPYSGALKYSVAGTIKTTLSTASTSS